MEDGRIANVDAAERMDARGEAHAHDASANKSTEARRAMVIAVLERCSSRSCDDAEDRFAIADALVAALEDDADARLVRAAFAHAQSGAAKIVVMRGLGGRREAEVLTAAARLAGCEVTA